MINALRLPLERAARGTLLCKLTSLIIPWTVTAATCILVILPDEMFLWGVQVIYHMSLPWILMPFCVLPRVFSSSARSLVFRFVLTVLNFSLCLLIYRFPPEVSWRSLLQR